MTDNEAVVHIHNNVGTKKGEIMLVSATWTQLENMMHFLTFLGGVPKPDVLRANSWLSVWGQS